MKINLSKHSIISRSQDSNTENYLNLKEMPIAYINVSDLVKRPVVSIQDNFAVSRRTEIRPYDSFNEPDIYLFNNNNELVQKTMKRVGDTYYYEPSDQVEFTPLNFEVYLEMQKQQQYYNDQIYDITVSAIDTTNDLSFVETLMAIFGDSYRKDICPSNIKFNGGSTNYMTLLENRYYNVDFVFIKSHDGFHYGNSTLAVDEIDIQGMLNSHVNVWLFCDNYGGRYHYSTNNVTENILLNMNSNILYSNKVISVPRNQALLLDQDIGFAETQDPYEYSYEYLNEAVLIVEKKNKGFLVISPSWFLEDIMSVAPVIYEGIIKCYLSRYYKSKTLSAWITDFPVDYLSYSNKRFGQTHNRLRLDDFLVNDTLYDDSTKIVDIRVTTPYVKYAGTTRNGDLSFKKVGGTTDPQKGSNEISFYTTKHTVINYKSENLFLVEVSIDLEFTVDSNVFFLIVHPYMSSEKGAFTEEDQTFKIEDLTHNYSLFIGKGSTDIRNTFYLLKDNEEPDISFIKVADISFETKQEPKIFDTRIMGGGLPADQPDDYDMLDIGHIFGRPYRVGSTLIVRLPIKLQSYKDRIITELDKHIAAGDSYVLVFEKQN